MSEVELLELILLEINDQKSTLSQQLSEVMVRQDATGGYMHMMMAGLGVLCLLTSWVAIWVTRR